MIYIIFGADDYSTHEALVSLKKGLGDPEALATNTTHLEGDHLTPAVLRANVEALPFLGNTRLVIVNRLLSRYETRTKSNPPKSPKKNTENDMAAFSAILGSVPPTTTIVLMDGELKKTNPFLKAIADKAEVKEYQPLTMPRIPDWIKQHTNQAEAAISDEAADKLAHLVGSNLWVLSAELEKLSLFTTGRCIEVTDIGTVVTASREVNVFELVDAIMDGRSSQALRLLRGFLHEGQAPSYILFMLARQLRLLVRTKSIIASGQGELYIQDKLKLYGFTLRRTLDQASRFSLPRLKSFYHSLLETDLAIKTSRYDEDLAISLLVTEACNR